MGKNKVIFNIVPVVLVVAVNLLRSYFGDKFGFGVVWKNIFFVLGWILGILLITWDKMIYGLFCRLEHADGQKIRMAFSKGKILEVKQLIKEHGKGWTRLPMSNALTLILISFVGVWVIMSTGSSVAWGVCFALSMGLGIKYWEQKGEGWFWIVNRKVADNEKRIFEYLIFFLLALQGWLLIV